MITKHSSDLGLHPGLRKKKSKEKKKPLKDIIGATDGEFNMGCELDSNMVSMLNFLILIIVLWLLKTMSLFPGNQNILGSRAGCLQFNL